MQPYAIPPYAMPPPSVPQRVMARPPTNISSARPPRSMSQVPGLSFQPTTPDQTLALISSNPASLNIPHPAALKTPKTERELKTLLTLRGTFHLGFDNAHLTYLSDTLQFAEVPEFQHVRATNIFFSENFFYFRDWNCLDHWVEHNLEFAPLLRRISVDVLDSSFTNLVKHLKRCSGLRMLFLGVNEREIVRKTAATDRGYQRLLMPPAEIDAQLNLVVLRANGMDALRAIRIEDVRFGPIYSSDRRHIYHGHRTGPIPDGILQTLVAKEMMQKPENKQLKRTASEASLRPSSNLTTAVQPFRFLDLPAELRNYIYQLVLCVNGKINPKPRIPTSHYLSGLNRQRNSASATRLGPEPPSVLTLVLTNKPIHQEATPYFYSKNQFVFYYPDQAIEYLDALTPSRKDHITAVTLWYPKSTYHEALLLESALRKIKHLKALQKLDIMLDEEPPRHLGEGLASHRPGERKLKKFVRDGVDVTIKSIAVENYRWDSATGAPEFVHQRGDYLHLLRRVVDFEKSVLIWP